MFENNLIAGSAGQATGFYPHIIDQSLRFNDDDSAYLSRTPATAGNRKTWTWSGWVKRGNVPTATSIGLLDTYIDSDNNTFIYFAKDGGTLQFHQEISGTTKNLNTQAVLRDPSSWYHIVISVDTTQVTSADRVVIYVNNEQQTLTGTFPSQNENTFFNNTNVHRIGASNVSLHFDGYLAEINFIDGQALDPTSFGEFKSGVWVANKYTGTYDTNGFYLPFENGIGDDESGNGNDWTPNNLAAIDIVLDSPTNNFATLNPLHRGSELGETLSESNLKYNSAPTTENYVCGTHSVSTGKWYFEVKPTASDTHGVYGFTNADNLDQTTNIGINPADTDNGGMIFPSLERYEVNGTSTSISITSTSIFGIALDADTGSIEFFENGISVGSGTITGITNYIPFASNFSNGTNRLGEANLNFGQDSSFAGNETAQGNTDENGIGDFYYTPPPGFLALCTANLPKPAISPADDASPSDYFNTVLYTGNEATRSITGVGFQPDWVWIKERSGPGSHRIFDVNRGVGQVLQSNLNTEELNRPTELTTFDVDGFSLGDSVTVNENGITHVAWNWKAGGAGVTNTDGSITSTVSASPESGFSIVNYTGTGSPESFGHGLSKRPEFVIAKNRDNISPWLTKHFEVMTDDKNYLDLNDTAPVQTAGSTTFILSTSNNSVVSYGTSGRVSNSSENYIAYCFHSVEGFSKFGSYTGNGSTDGPFVYTGFRPAFVMVKRTDSTGSWIIHDTSRDIDNPTSVDLYANLSNGDTTSSATDRYDFLSNGFKLRVTTTNVNASGGTYIYMAFAENPFKFSNAR